VLLVALRDETLLTEFVSTGLNAGFRKAGANSKLKLDTGALTMTNPRHSDPPEILNASDGAGLPVVSVMVRTARTSERVRESRYCR